MNIVNNLCLFVRWFAICTFRMTPVQYFNTETKQKRKKKFRADHISIKKKALKYENEVLKCQELVKNAPYEYGDRFIPRRYMYGHQISAHSSFNLNHSDEDLDIFDLKACKGYWRLHSHCHNVKVILGLDIEQDVLQLHDWITQSMCRRSLNNLPIVDSIAMLQRNAGGLDWPCKPRPIPLAYNDSTHDLPEFHRYSHYNIIAWSSQGKIAASFGRDLVLWGPPSTKTRQKITTVYRVGLVRTLAFNHHGTLLALGVYDVAKSKLQIYQLIQEKSDYAGDSLFNKEGICEIGQYIIHKSGIDDIRAIEWDPHENYIMCGMFSGTVHMIKYPLEPPPQLATCTSLPNIKTCDHHAKNCISNIKYSLKRTYIAIVDYGGNLSIRRRKKFKEIYHALKDVDFFSWHPWNEKDLFIGESITSSIDAHGSSCYMLLGN